jgi:DNA polymerase-1
LDTKQAKELLETTTGLQDEYLSKLREAFPRRLVERNTFTPKITKSGEMNKVQKNWLLNYQHKQNDDGSYTLYEYEEEFNPKSGKQLAARLIELGWVPLKFTPTGQPSTKTEDITSAIDQLKAKVPAVAVLEKYNIIFDRRNKAEKWLKLVSEAGDGKIHGKVWHIGAWTHRCSHTDDNMANVPSVEYNDDKTPKKGLDGNFGYECRNCWTVSDPSTMTMVGVDAEGIQLRALAHYMNDPEYIKQLLEGDIHVVNQKAAGIKTRPTAKTFIYAWLLGAGDPKIGVIVGVDEDEIDAILSQSANETKRCIAMLKKKGLRAFKKSVAIVLKGRRTKKKFLDSLPHLKHFKEVVIPEAAAKGWMHGLDGRVFHIPSEHLAMAAYLQGFEAVVMKWAMKKWNTILKKKGIPFKQLLMVHDEWVIETPTEYKEIVGKVVADSIEWAGKLLGSNCPLAGKAQYGKSWADCH